MTEPSHPRPQRRPTSLAEPVVACAGILRGAPGPGSAAVLAAWSYQPGEAPDSPSGPLSEVVDVTMAGRRLEGWALWCQLSALARLLVAWGRRPPLGDASRGTCEGEDPALARRLGDVADDEQAVCRRLELNEEQLAPAYVAAEIGLSCGLSRSAATQRVTVARALLVEGRHPRIAALARGGFLDWSKAYLLVTRLGQVDALVAGCVEERLIPDRDLATVSGPVDVRADPRRPGEILPFVTRTNVHQLRTAIDEAIEAVDPDGAADRGRRARAERRVSTHPESDGMARLEAYAGAETVAAAINDLAAAAAAAQAAGDTRTRDQISVDELFFRLTRGAYGAPATTAPQADPRGRDERGRGLAVGLTMPLSTWLGLASDPGQLGGYGPIAGALARQIAAEAAHDHPATTTWQCLITDDVHGTVIGLGRPIRTPRHDPPPRLAAFVRAAQPHCVFPGCTVPVSRCDIDHRVPYPHGPTCACNLQPLCRSHHRLKTAGHISVRLLQPGEDPTAPPGTVEWTTRAGFVYRRSPETPVPAALEPALTGVPAGLAARRHARAAHLRTLNADLRAAFARAHHRRLDDSVAGASVDADETVEHPPASIDDDPAPSGPERPLEAWSDTFDRWQQALCPSA